MRQFNRRISFLITVLKIPFHLLLIIQFHIIMDFQLILPLENKLESVCKQPDFKFSSHREAFFAEAILLKSKGLLRRFAPRNDSLNLKMLLLDRHELDKMIIIYKIFNTIS